MGDVSRSFQNKPRTTWMQSQMQSLETLDSQHLSSASSCRFHGVLLSLDFCWTGLRSQTSMISHIISQEKNRQVCNGVFGPCTPTIFLVENASQLALVSLVSLVAVKGTHIPSSLNGADLVQSQERQEFFHVLSIHRQTLSQP